MLEYSECSDVVTSIGGSDLHSRVTELLLKGLVHGRTSAEIVVVTAAGELLNCTELRRS